jgi:phosphate transport system substrate-binding protein
MYHEQGNKMKKHGLMLILMSILLGCAPRSGRIDIAGSTTILPIAQAVAEAYMETNETAAISVRGGGSSVGLTSIIEKTIEHYSPSPLPMMPSLLSCIQITR